MQTVLSKFCNREKISTKELAKRLDFSISFVLKIRHGEYQPSYNFLKKFKEEFPDFDMNIFFLSLFRWQF